MVRLVLEISGNHGGDLAQCRKLIAAAKKLKPASIKFQTFEPGALALKRQNNAEVAAAIAMLDSTAEQRWQQLLQLYDQIHTPKAWWPDLLAELNGYAWSASVFSVKDLLFLEDHSCPAYKIASFELHDLPLIHACAVTKKPLTMSVNAAASAEDVGAAIEAAAGAERITVLHASAYAHKKSLTWKTLHRERERYNWLAALAPPHIEVGLSDHSPPNDLWLSTYALEKDADMLERHICLPGIKTPDSSFSSTPRQLAKYMQRISTRAQARNRLETAAR